MKDTEILGIKFDNYNINQIIEKIDNMVISNKFNMIVTPNPEIVMMALKDDSYKNIINQSDLVVPDGIGIILASKLKNKSINYRVSGIDIILKLFENKKYRFYLLGSKGEVIEGAASKINNDYNGVNIVGYHDGYFDNKVEENIINEINDKEVDILLVGLGAPKQEKWIYNNREKLKCKAAIGVGGSFDVLSGNIKRAPQWMQKTGLEWLYRLIKQPSRIKRMLILPIYLIRVIFSK